MFRVVVVEDEELLRMGLTNFFDWKAYDFELAGEAGNGLKGLAVLRETKPDLVITDIKMPHMDGIEMVETIKTEIPDLQVLVISGYDEFSYAKRALKAGVSEYILKPIKMDDLKEAVGRIRDILQKKRREKEELELLKNSHRKGKRSQRAALYAGLLLKGIRVKDADRDLVEEAGQLTYLAGVIALQNFSVLYMDCDYSLILEKDQELGRILEEGLESVFSQQEKEQIEILRSGNGERLICISGSTREEVSSLQKRLEEKLNGQKEDIEPLEMSFGQIVKGLEGLVSSCRTARKKQEDRFARSWQEAAGSTGKDVPGDFGSYDADYLCQVIKNGTQADVKMETERLRQTLMSEHVASYLQLVLIISNIFYKVIRIPRECGENIEDVTGDPRICYQQLIGKMKRDDMLEELTALCLKLHSYCQKGSGDRKQEVMYRVNVYIQEHFGEETLSMKDVAEHVFISVSYLGMLMKKETGKTFTEYLTDVRMERAKQLLKNSSMKTYEIAQACGYATPAYFSTVFKTVVGMPPSEYRSVANSESDN